MATPPPDRRSFGYRRVAGRSRPLLLLSFTLGTTLSVLYLTGAASSSRDQFPAHWSSFLDRHKFTTWTLVARHEVGPEAALLTFRPIQRYSGLWAGFWSRNAPQQGGANDIGGDGKQNGLGRGGFSREQQEQERTDKVSGPVRLEQLGASAYDDLYARGTWSVQVVHPGLNVGREYTPVPPLLSSQTTAADVPVSLDDSNRASDSSEILAPSAPSNTTSSPLPPTSADPLDLTLYVRRQGETSRYLHALGLGTEIRMRGPEMSYALSQASDPPGAQKTHVSHTSPPPLSEPVEKVLFLAGGTGIAPALQLLRGLELRNNRQGQSTEMSLLWANRGRETCIGARTDGDLQIVLAGGGSGSGISGLLKGVTSFFRSSSPPTLESPAAGPDSLAQSSPIVTHLRCLADAHPHKWTTADAAGPKDLTQAQRQHAPAPLHLSTAFFVDAENTFIRPEDLRALLTRFARSVSQATPGLHSSPSTPPTAPGTRSNISTSHPISPSNASSSSSNVGSNDEALSTKTGRKLLIVSGPPGFVSYFAGPTAWSGGVEVQGPLGGVLTRLRAEGRLEGWEVWKL